MHFFHHLLHQQAPLGDGEVLDFPRAGDLGDQDQPGPTGVVLQADVAEGQFVQGVGAGEKGGIDLGHESQWPPSPGRTSASGVAGRGASG